MSVIVVATLYPLPQFRSEVLETMASTIPMVHDEPGCELYALHEGTDRLVMIERWASQDALDTHAAGPALAKLGPQLEGKLAVPLDVQTMTAHPAGDPGKGAL